MHPAIRHLRLGHALLALISWGALAQAQTAVPAAQPATTGTRPQASPSTATPSPAMFSGPEYSIGSPRAKVTVVEYASASCPHCARFDINVFPLFKKKYIDTGKVRYVFREFLTPPEDVAAAGFLLARCAGANQYFRVVEQVFHDQEELYRTGDLKGIFTRIGASVGLTEPQIQACLNDKPALEALNARLNEAIDKAKIESTPSFLINGALFRGDAHKEVDLPQLDGAIQPLLSSHAARRARG